MMIIKKHETAGVTDTAFKFTTLEATAFQVLTLLIVGLVA